ncbi:phage Gp37/Gp68 family protein [Acidovorax sp. A1169]|uniref:phage Gp37/Gp68 family protein n=1 Tax=Acidovorax sp. A1169 TaxID=3059524 RepID=UPI002737FFA1|nr:phage Gp37/Gp68 family protein [Acidovorax sp. A1169]MDP4076198.1 phage Gp37/Gp68 family protein [Acidovorax sp. A1169]
MSENSKIEWTDHTFNPWEGCQKVGPGCDHCYAETRNARFAGGTAINWGPGAPRRRTSASNWELPKRWNAQADAFMAQHGRRQRVFCASLADVFDNAVDLLWREDLFALINATPNLDWLLLTKRIGNVPAMVSIIPGWLPDNVWLGATIVNQEEADRDIPKLLRVPARVRFLSMEPLLGPVNLRRWLQPHCERHPGQLAADGKCEVCEGRGIWDMPGAEQLQEHEKGAIRPGLDWVIAGGESGPGARPTLPQWPCYLRNQCTDARVPFLFKQWGEWHTQAYSTSTGEPVFRQFTNFQEWVNKAQTWVQGGICLDVHGRELRNGGDMARARDADGFPVTIMHKVGKKAAGRLLDGRTWDGFPTAVQEAANG